MRDSPRRCRPVGRAAAVLGVLALAGGCGDAAKTGAVEGSSATADGTSVARSVDGTGAQSLPLTIGTGDDAVVVVSAGAGTTGPLDAGHAIGSTARLSRDGVWKLDVRLASFARWTGPELRPRTAGTVLWAARVAYANAGETPVDCNLQTTLTLADGSEAAEYAGLEDPFFCSRLQPGRSYAGAIVFEVPDGVVARTLTFTPGAQLPSPAQFDLG